MKNEFKLICVAVFSVFSVATASAQETSYSEVDNGHYVSGSTNRDIMSHCKKFRLHQNGKLEGWCTNTPSDTQGGWYSIQLNSYLSNDTNNFTKLSWSNGGFTDDYTGELSEGQTPGAKCIKLSLPSNSVESRFLQIEGSCVSTATNNWIWRSLKNIDINEKIGMPDDSNGSNGKSFVVKG